MSPLIAAASGLVGAVIFAAGSLWFELSGAPASISVATILVRLPHLAPPVIAVYAALVLLTATAALITDIIRIRSRLKNPSRQDRALWSDAFTGTALSRLASRLVRVTSARSTSPGETILAYGPSEARTASDEIARLYQNWLTRGHFFTALIILLGLGTVGLAEEYGLIVSGAMPIATIPVFVATLSLIVLAVYFRLTVDAAAEPLIDALASPPFERLEVSLLQSIAAALQQRPTAAALDGPSPQIDPAIEALARSLSRGRRSFEKIVAQLSKNAEVIASATHVLADQPHQSQGAGIDTKILAQLQLAVERLTTTIEGLPSIAQNAIVSAHQSIEDSSLSPRQATQDDNDLSEKLRRLLDDLE